MRRYPIYALFLFYLVWYAVYFMLDPLRFAVFWRNTLNAPGYAWFAANNTARDKDTPHFACVAMLAVFAYPMISWCYEKRYAGTLYVVPFSYENDRSDGYLLVRGFQSKMFWYRVFKSQNIATPRVVFFSAPDGEVQALGGGTPETNTSKLYVAKPDNGTDGVGIYTTTISDFVRFPPQNTAYVLQDLLKDCFTKKARSFRVCTALGYTQKPFFVAEYTQNQKRDAIQTNRGENGGTRDLNPRLSANEREMLNQVFKKLYRLQVIFWKVPVIGFDVILTCRGPFVLEGNLGRSVPDHLIPELKQMLRAIPY